MKIKVMLEDGAYMPTKAHKTDAGFDLYVPEGMHFKLGIRRSCIVCTGVHMDIPTGFVGLIENRSGLNFKSSVTLHGAGVVDAHYIGGIGVKLYNDSDKEISIEAGDRVAQIVIVPIPEVELEKVGALTDTDRGTNGFGSSGR